MLFSTSSLATTFLPKESGIAANILTTEYLKAAVAGMSARQGNRLTGGHPCSNLEETDTDS